MTRAEADLRPAPEMNANGQGPRSVSRDLSPGAKSGTPHATQPAGWISTGGPLLVCIMIWGLEGGPATHKPWLTILHDVVGLAATLWTVLRMVLTGAIRRVYQRKVGAARLSPDTLVLYALLLLQPTLALASSMLHGSRTTIFWIYVPSVLPASPLVAEFVDYAHLINTLALLAVIIVQIWTACAAQRCVGEGRDGREPATPKAKPS
jgi:cytochrome b561